uniref:Uncharacterized protein n=1 Tax=Anguilla anguilla TaxID=7936 RepID=A0A0E9UBE4_ANGAN
MWPRLEKHTFWCRSSLFVPFHFIYLFLK